MSSQFGQFCPIALASEVLSQKWMLLVIRELNAGATRFNEIKRGVPRISASLLKTRLDQLEGAGILERRPISPEGPEEYLLTEAGSELKQVLASIGTWGQRWARDIEQEDLDPGWLVWAMHRRIDTGIMPEGRTVIAIQFSDAPRNHRAFWLVCKHPEVEVCLKHPGFDEDVRISTSVCTMAEVWRGIRPLHASIADDALRIDCVPGLRDKVPNWLMLSIFAGVQKVRA